MNLGVGEVVLGHLPLLKRLESVYEPWSGYLFISAEGLDSACFAEGKEGGCMRPLKRRGTSKGRSAGLFRRHTSRTKAPNVSQGLMRGGWRL